MNPRCEPTETWAIHLDKEYFKFSCAHFLIFPDGTKERLHGHNYRVRAEIEGPIDEHGLVIDFLEAKPILRAICDALDEHWIVPAKHPELKVEHLANDHSSVVYRDKHYLVPSEELIVLPINNVSVENLAAWIADELRDAIHARFGVHAVSRLRISVSETPGQSGVYERRAGVADDR